MINGTAQQIQLGVGDAVVPLHSHVACFVESDQDLAAAVGFLAEGARGGDHAVVLAAGHEQRRLSALLTEKGVDAAQLAAQRRLSFVHPADSANRMLDAVAGAMRAMLQAGAKVVRLLLQIGWFEPGWPAATELVDLEARLTLAVQEAPCVALCVYDLRVLPSLVLRYGAMDSHALIVQHGTLQRNPQVLPPEMALKQLPALSDVFLELERRREALPLYAAMFANTTDPLAIVRVEPGSEHTTVVEINPAARQIVGCFDAAHCSLSHCFPGFFGARFGELSRRIAEDGGGADLGDVPVGDGFYHIRVFSLSGNYLGISFSDTTLRKKTENALLSLRQLSSALHATLEVDDILDELVKGATAIVGAESGVAALCSADGVSSYRYLVNGVPWQGEEREPAPGRVIHHAYPHLSNDPLHDPCVNPERARRYQVRNALCTPIVDLRKNLVGFLEIHNKRGEGGFTSFDQDQLASAAQTAALALRNAHAFRKISEMGSRLRDSIERFRHLVEGLDAIVWEADAETFRFTYVSRRGETILGYPISQWLEEPDFWVKHIHPDDREGAIETCRKATREGKGHRFVYRAVAADGRTVWLRDHARVVLEPEGQVRQLRGLMVDITETMAIEESLRKSEARFRATFEGAGIGMALVEASGRLLQVNPALKNMMGRSCDELTRSSFDTLCHPDDASSDRDSFQALMEGRLPRYQVEKRFRGGDGGELWGRVTFSAITIDGGTQYAIAMVEDISERKKAEAAVAALLAQVQKDAAELEERVAERTSQLEEINAELDSFAHSVSHDLRAPLRAVQGYAEILLEDSSLAEAERCDYLKRILTSAQNMDRLIQNLLAYSRLSRQEIPLQPVSMERVVHEAAQQLELACGAKKYRLEVKGELPEVMGHQTVLVQVLLNLLSNGIKFVPAGVTPRLRIWSEQRGGACRIFIEDNGIGIRAEHQERIFKIFERLDGMESYPGTGVGLAIVKKAITRLGGSIGLESREGEGSTFWIELPCRRQGKEEP